MLNYWGRIPYELASRIREIVRKSGYEKVNIIAHSKGGLDSRYAIAYCGIEEYVASLITINTPHRGCVFTEWLLSKVPSWAKDKIASSYNNAAVYMGDGALNKKRSGRRRVFLRT